MHLICWIQLTMVTIVLGSTTQFITFDFCMSVYLVSTHSVTQWMKNRWNISESVWCYLFHPRCELHAGDMSSWSLILDIYVWHHVGCWFTMVPPPHIPIQRIHIFTNMRVISVYNEFGWAWASINELFIYKWTQRNTRTQSEDLLSLIRQ